jgi:tripartite-type tricarboxylate transporter receptor subunit TctC
MPADREEAGEGFPLTSTLNPEPRFPGVSFTDSRLVMKRKRAGRPYGGRSADLALQHDSWSHILSKRQKKTVREVVSMRSIIGAGAIWLALCAAAPAQDYPTRTIRVIIPLGAGGGGDVFTRALADELQKALRQPVVVENRTGGALNIGARACAEAAPDGYTICVLSSEPVVYNQFVFKSLPFDPEKDFEPISNLFFNTLALVANSSLKVKTIADLVALAKARPGTLSYGTFSFPLAHFMEKLKTETGADIVRVPFRSGSEVVNAVLSGSTPVAVLALSNMVPQLQSGHITGLVVTGKTRSPLFPTIPTLAEVRSGENYPATWFGLFAPAGTPRPIVLKLASEVTRIVNDRDFRQRMFIDRAVEPAGTGLEEFARFIRDERKLAERIVKDSGMQPE